MRLFPARRRYRLLLAVLLIVGVPYYWLLVDNHEAQVPQVHLDLVAMRRLAEAVPGAKPERVTVHEVASSRMPGTLMVAGGGLRFETVSAFSFVLTGGEGSVVIDSGMPRALARDLLFRRYRPASQARVEAAMRRARLILFTHEHPDHIAGFLASPAFPSIAGRALVTPEQIVGARADKRIVPRWRARLATIRPFPYRRMAAVAPGVVLVRTPGHTPGSQMVYVRLADGQEVLFAGDTASTGRSWQWERARSRLLADHVAPEDRGAVLGWLRALGEVKQRAPGLVIVTGSDHGNLDLLEEAQGPAEAR